MTGGGGSTVMLEEGVWLVRIVGICVSGVVAVRGVGVCGCVVCVCVVAVAMVGGPPRP